MKIRYIIQGILLLCILLFLGQFLKVPKDSSTPFKTVVSDTTQSMDLDKYNKESNKNIRRFLKVDPTEYQNISYYKNKDDMQASEIVIVKFKNNSQDQAFTDAMESRMDDQANIYDGYLPKQATLVKKGVTYTQANYGIYVVNRKTDAIVEDFKDALQKGESK